MNYAALSASNGNGEAVRATVQSVRNIGSTAILVNATTNWPTGQFIATTGKLLANGTLDPSTAQVFYGTAANTTITITSFAPGYTDKGNSVNDVVVLKPNTEWANTIGSFIANATGHGTPQALSASSLVLPSHSITPAQIVIPPLLRAYYNQDYVGPTNTWYTSPIQLVDGLNIGGWTGDGVGWIVPVSGNYLVSVQVTHQDNTGSSAQIIMGMATSATSTPPAQPGWYNRVGFTSNPCTMQSSRLFTLSAGTHVFLQTYAASSVSGNYRLRSGNANDGTWLELLFVGPN
jgi:hypothetical protein